jgi:predicted nucleic acid-binding protein
MAIRSFIDTNVLIYAEASDEPLKQRAAIALLKSLFLDGQGVLSTQVLQEYCNVALKKLKLSAQHVRAQLDLYEQFEIVQVTPAIIHAGLDLHQTRSISFFDAVVLASAHASGCEVIWTEDMNTAEVINGVRIANPFMDSVAF